HSYELEPNPSPGRSPGREVKERFLIDVVHHNRHSAVISQITERGSPAAARFREAAFFVADHGKSPVAQVAKKLVRLPVGVCGPFHLRIDVTVGDKQFFPAVVIEIDEASAPSQLTVAGGAQTCLKGHVFELAMVIVV